MDDKTPQSIEVDDLQKPEPQELPKDSNTQKPSGAPDSDTAKYVTLDDYQKLKKQLDGVSYALRHVKEIPSQIEELKRAISSTPSMTPSEKQEAKDELDLLIEQGDWKTAVRKLASKEAENLLRSRDEEIQRRQVVSESETRLEESKRKVLEKYPELNDPDSEITRKYIEIRNKYPHFNRNEAGPLLAMYAMEEELRSEGKLDTSTRKIVDKEVLRQTRVGAISKDSRGSSPTSKSITLTKEQKEFCDSVGLKYEDYLKNIPRSSGEGVETNG